MSVETPLAVHTAKVKEWLLVRAAMQGEPMIMESLDELKGILASPVYTLKTWALPDGTVKNNQSALDKRKQAYWGRPVLVPVVQRTVNALEGMIWAGEPLVEYKGRMKEVALNVRNISQEVTQDLIAIGRCGAWADAPQQAGTLATQKPATALFIEAERIFFWRMSGVQLTEVRFTELYEESNGEFDIEVKLQIRRLLINADGVYESQVYRDCELFETVVPTANKKAMTSIPFVFFGADENSPKLGATPMYCMSRMNLAHFRLDADDRDNLHYHGQAMTVVSTDLSADEFLENNGGVVDMGASGLNLIDSAGSITRSQIDATGAIGAKMDKDMENMIAAGAQLVKSTNDTTTLGAREMEFSSSTSVMKKVARNQSEGMTQLVNFMCDFMGEPHITYEMQPKFITDNIDAAMLQVVMQYVMSLGMPIELAYDAARKANLTSLTDDELKDMSEQQADKTTVPMSEDAAKKQAEKEAEQEENKDGE